MNRHVLIAIAGACFINTSGLMSTVVWAQGVPADVPDAQRVGSGQLIMFFIPVFDATLYAPAGHWNPNKPFALKLSYLHTFKGADIVKSSVTEMRKQGVPEATLQGWKTDMMAIFPDVTKGSSITGVRDASGAAVFYSGGKMLGTIKDPAFSQHFFAIWLGAQTSQPVLRQHLLGQT